MQQYSLPFRKTGDQVISTPQLSQKMVSRYRVMCRLRNSQFRMRFRIRGNAFAQNGPEIPLSRCFHPTEDRPCQMAHIERFEDHSIRTIFPPPRLFQVLIGDDQDKAPMVFRPVFSE
jgi:hypothetical protein